MRSRSLIRRVLCAVALTLVAGCACRPEPDESPTTAPPPPAPAPAKQEAAVSERPSGKPATEHAPGADAVADAPAAAAERFTGTLRGGIVAVGAETTGWQLQRPDGTRVDVDVSKAADAAGRLDGKPVVIHGGMTKANWLERGEQPLIIAERIEPAPDGK